MGEIIDENLQKSTKMIPQSNGLFQSGHKKLGGMKKGYESLKTITRKILMEVIITKDKQTETKLEAIFNKQIEKAMKGNLKSIKFLLDCAEDTPYKNKKGSR